MEGASPLAAVAMREAVSPAQVASVVMPEAMLAKIAEQFDPGFETFAIWPLPDDGDEAPDDGAPEGGGAAAPPLVVEAPPRELLRLVTHLGLPRGAVAPRRTLGAPRSATAAAADDVATVRASA